MKDKMYLIEDAQMDILRGLNKLTDMNDPSTCAIHDLAEAAEKLDKMLHRNEDDTAPMADHYDHPDWGHADPEARRLFEDLEKDFMRYQKHKASYKMTHIDADKHAMLAALKDEMHSHQALAEYVKKHCIECAEEKAVVMEAVAEMHKG